MAATPAPPHHGEVGPGRVEFRGPRGATLTTDHEGVKRALVRIGAAWPAAVPVAELDGDVVCETLLRAYAANLVHLHVWEPEMAAPSSALWRARWPASRPPAARA